MGLAPAERKCVEELLLKLRGQEVMKKMGLVFVAACSTAQGRWAALRGRIAKCAAEGRLCGVFARPRCETFAAERWHHATGRRRALRDPRAPQDCLPHRRPQEKQKCDFETSFADLCVWTLRLGDEVGSRTC